MQQKNEGGSRNPTFHIAAQVLPEQIDVFPVVELEFYDSIKTRLGFSCLFCYLSRNWCAPFFSRQYQSLHKDLWAGEFPRSTDCLQMSEIGLDRVLIEAHTQSGYDRAIVDDCAPLRLALQSKNEEIWLHLEIRLSLSPGVEDVFHVIHVEPVARGHLTPQTLIILLPFRGDSAETATATAAAAAAAALPLTHVDRAGLFRNTLFSSFLPRHLNFQRDGASLLLGPAREAVRTIAPVMTVQLATQFADFDGDENSVALASVDGLRKLGLMSGTWVLLFRVGKWPPALTTVSQVLLSHGDNYRIARLHGLPRPAVPGAAVSLPPVPVLPAAALALPPLLLRGLGIGADAVVAGTAVVHVSPFAGSLPLLHSFAPPDSSMALVTAAGEAPPGIDPATEVRLARIHAPPISASSLEVREPRPVQPAAAHAVHRRCPTTRRSTARSGGSLSARRAYWRSATC
jgi:hypothetical protein